MDLSIVPGAPPLPSAPARRGGDLLPPGGNAVPAGGDGRPSSLKFSPLASLMDSAQPATREAGRIEALFLAAVRGEGVQGDPAGRVPLPGLVQAADTDAALPFGTVASGLAGPPSAAAADGTGRPPPPVVMGSQGFADAVGGRVQWLARSGQQFARIDVSPANLGPVEIHIQVDGDHAQVTFGSQHAPVRDALEAAVPRLREMLGQSGLQLVNVSVGQQGAHDPRQQNPAGTAGGGFAGPDAVDVGTGTGPSAIQAAIKRGLVDDYA